MAENNTPKTKKGYESKQKIFQNAIELIQTKNYEDITIREICEKSNISIGMFYHHFNSKQDILFDYIRLEGEDVYDFYHCIEETSNYIKLLKTYEYQFNYFKRKGRKFISLILGFELADYGNPNSNHIRLYDYAIHKITEECIKKGQASGEFTLQHSSDFLSNSVSNEFTGLTYYWITKGKIDNAYTELFPKFKELIDILLFD